MDWMQGKIIELRAEVERLQKSSSSSSSSSQSNASTPLTVDEISKCKLCNTCIKTAEIEYHVCIDGGTLSCKYCIQVFTSTDSFLKHLADANHRTLMKRDREAKKFFKCNKCQLAYTMRVLLKCHKKSHEEPVLDTTPAPVKKVSDVVLSSDKNVVTVDIKQIISKPIASPLEIAHSGNCKKKYYAKINLFVAFSELGIFDLQITSVPSVTWRLIALLGYAIINMWWKIIQAN